MVDGKPIYSCTMLALEAQGKPIKTAEALVSGGKLDKVPAAFAQADAQQCGFCTPGFVLAMRGAFDANPKPTSADTEKALFGLNSRSGPSSQIQRSAPAPYGKM